MSFLKLSCGTEMKPFRCPKEGMADISSFISTKTIEKGKPMLLGDDFVQMMTLNDFPTENYSCMLSNLLALPFPFRWSTRWIPYSNKESQQKATKLRNSFKAAQKGWKSAMYEASSGKESQNINTQAVTDANAVERQRHFLKILSRVHVRRPVRRPDSAAPLANLKGIKGLPRRRL